MDITVYQVSSVKVITWCMPTNPEISLTGCALILSQAAYINLLSLTIEYQYRLTPLNYVFIYEFMYCCYSTCKY